jgi:hypothetical protein
VAGVNPCGDGHEEMARLMLGGGAMLWPHALLVGWLRHRPDPGPICARVSAGVTDPPPAIPLGGRLLKENSQVLATRTSDPKPTWRMISRKRRHRSPCPSPHRAIHRGC